MTTLELTTNEAIVLRTIPRWAFSYFDDGIKVGSHTYSAVFVPEVAELLDISEQGAGGVVSSLIQKDIFKSIQTNYGKNYDNELQLTEVGVDTIKTLGVGA